MNEYSCLKLNCGPVSMRSPQPTGSTSRYLAREDGLMRDCQDEMAGHLPYRAAAPGLA